MYYRSYFNFVVNKYISITPLDICIYKLFIYKFSCHTTPIYILLLQFSDHFMLHMTLAKKYCLFHPLTRCPALVRFCDLSPPVCLPAI